MYKKINYDTVTLISEKLFAKKKTNLEQWCDFMSHEQSLADELVITLLSLMTMIHTCVMYRTLKWLTCKGGDSDSATVFLAYLGKGSFVLIEDIPKCTVVKREH